MKPIVDDALWELVEPLLPSRPRRKKHPERRRLDDRPADIHLAVLELGRVVISFGALPRSG